MLVVVPCGGLGNRLMALTSARLLAEHLGCPLQVCWRSEWFVPGSRCPVTELFEGIDSVSLAEPEPAPGFHHRHHVEGPAPEVEARLRAGETVYLHSYCLIWPQNMDRVEYYDRLYGQFDRLRPRPEIRARVPDLPAGTVGIHVRRVDNWRSIRYSPLALFFRVMDRLGERQPDARFFLATDDDRVRSQMKQRYGSRILTLDPPDGASPVEAAQAALVDMLALARACAIYHSCMSSFSFIAHLMSRCPRRRVAVARAPVGWHTSPADQRHDELILWNRQTGRWARKSLPEASLGALLQRERLIHWTRFVCSDAFQLWPGHRLGDLGEGT